MALDGITIAAIVDELNYNIINGRISKIAQPENDELLLTIKNNSTQYRLILSSSSSLPLVYLCDENKISPITAPPFCMLLRKHIQNGRIVSIYQPDFERIIVFEIEHLNEMGDVCHKKIIIELMGKYSNIIFTDMEDNIIDSIKHISAMVSSVREVLPGCQYFIPRTQEKQNPLTTDETMFINQIFSKNMECFKSLYTSFTGISPMISHEICYRLGIIAEQNTDSFTNDEKHHLFTVFSDLMNQVKEKNFDLNIFYENSIPIDYSCIKITSYKEEQCVHFKSVSQLLLAYYKDKEKITRIRQKSVDLRKIVQTSMERDIKKYDLQVRQLKDTEKMEQYKVYGELLHTYGYTIVNGAKSCELLNYYTNEPVTIPLDPMLTPMDNAKKYFDKYSKLKRTKEALSTLIIEVKGEIDHLESIATALDIAQKEEDLSEIKEELIDNGYMKRKGEKKKQRFKSKPFHYLSSDGFDIYVGKNNYQNDELTFKFATGNDWWFHAKGIPGSHVIIKSDGKDIPDHTFEEAGKLAAHYSKGKGQEKIEIDYTQKKNVKKPAGAKPGFVVYYTNFSLMIDSDISNIKSIEGNI